MAISSQVIQDRLDEARESYHSLQTGTMARVTVDMDGSRVEFVAANASKLYAYIQSLEAQLPSVQAFAGNNGPATFTF